MTPYLTQLWSTSADRWTLYQRKTQLVEVMPDVYLLDKDKPVTRFSANYIWAQTMIFAIKGDRHVIALKDNKDLMKLPLATGQWSEIQVPGSF